MWIHGLGGERLTRCPTLFAQTWKRWYFLPSQMDRDFLSSVLFTTPGKRFFVRRLADTRHISPAFVWSLWPGVGRCPQRARPVQISWHNRCFWLSMSDEDSDRHPGFGRGGHEHRAGFARAIKHRVSGPGKFNICRAIYWATGRDEIFFRFPSSW